MNREAGREHLMTHLVHTVFDFIRHRDEKHGKTNPGYDMGVAWIIREVSAGTVIAVAVSFNPLKCDSSWQMVLPGCYIDPAGSGHLFPDELLAFLSVAHPEAGFDPNSKSDYDLVVNEFSRLLKHVNPGMPVRLVNHDRQEH